MKAVGPTSFLRRFWPAALLAGIATVQLLCVPGRYFGNEVDDVYYVLASRSVLRGHYTLGISPGDPPLTFITPGWPLLLSPAAAFSGDSAGGYHLWTWGWLVVCGVLVWLWLRRRMDPAGAAAAAALFGLNPVVLSRAGVPTSEIPFLAAALGLILCLETRRSFPAWAAGLWLGFCWLIRPGALPLFPAVGGWYLWRALGWKVAGAEGTQAADSPSNKRRWAELAAAAACAALPVLAWRLWLHSSGEGFSETGELGLLGRLGPLSLAALVWKNLCAIWAWLGASLLPWTSGSPTVSGTVLGGAFFVAGLAGLGLRLRRDGYDAGAAFAFLTIGMYACWPFWYDRYLPTFLPFLIWGAWRVLGFALRSETARALALSVLVLFPFPQILAQARSGPANQRPPFSETYAWVSGHTEPHALFTSVFYARDAFYSGRPFIALPYDGRTPFAESARARRVRYVLWNRVPNLGAGLAPELFSGHYQKAERELLGDGFRLLYANPRENTAVFRVSDEKS